MGSWSSCAAVGDILGAQLGSLMLSQGHVAWEAVVLTTCAILFTISFLYFVYGKDTPDEDMICANKSIQLVQPGEEIQKEDNKKGISFLKAWTLPGVLVYALTYGCVKMLNYSMIM